MRKHAMAVGVEAALAIGVRMENVLAGRHSTESAGSHQLPDAQTNAPVQVMQAVRPLATEGVSGIETFCVVHVRTTYQIGTLMRNVARFHNASTFR
jgi:hypothetical protein